MRTSTASSFPSTSTKRPSRSSLAVRTSMGWKLIRGPIIIKSNDAVLARFIPDWCLRQKTRERHARYSLSATPSGAARPADPWRGDNPTGYETGRGPPRGRGACQYRQGEQQGIPARIRLGCTYPHDREWPSADHYGFSGRRSNGPQKYVARAATGHDRVP